jgi:hypothetical protein
MFQLYTWFHSRHNKFNMIDNMPFKRLYIGTHTNLGCYWIGIWAGYKMHKLQASTRQLSHKIYFYVVVLLGFVVIMSGYLFYVHEFEKPSVWCAVYAGLHKITFGWGLVYVLWCFSQNIESEWSLREWL